MAKKFVYNEETAVVQTKRGKVRGYQYDGITVFKGIPYASARRFHAPEPVKEWEGVLDATNYGYVCPLPGIGKPNGELSTPHRFWAMDEDCQNLNIWTPACDGGKRPVLVWLHGGGYSEGSSIEQVAYEGGNMCRLGDVVVVSLNHRLNILGYLDLSPYGEEYANSANAGGDDIIAALKWIQVNIAAFGGDPENVTLFGQSGGGAKITALLQSPAADGLYARGINMSGVIPDILPDAEGDSRGLVDALMEELGIPGDVRALETVDYHDLAKAYSKLKPRFEQAGGYVGCAPKKNDFYYGDPLKYGFREETAQVPLIVGTVFGEFTAVTAPTFDKSGVSEDEAAQRIAEFFGDRAAAEELIPLFREAYPDRNLLDLLTLDFVFRSPASAYIRKRSAGNRCTWSYLFNQDFPLNYHSVPWHCSDIAFVFHNTEYMEYAQMEGVTEKLEEEIFAAVMAFAKTGDPNNAQIPQWPASTETEEHTMFFEEQVHLRTNHDSRLMPLYVKHMAPVFFRKMDEIFNKVQH